MTFGNWDEALHFDPKQVTKIANALKSKIQILHWIRILKVL